MSFHFFNDNETLFFSESEFYDINVLKGLMELLPGPPKKKSEHGPHRLEEILQFTEYLSGGILEKVREIASNTKRLSPYIIIAQKDELPIRFYVAAYDAVYPFETFVGALDMLFKTFFSLNVPYPVIVRAIYVFIQKLFYNIHVEEKDKKTTSAVDKLINNVDHTRL